VVDPHAVCCGNTAPPAGETGETHSHLSLIHKSRHIYWRRTITEDIKTSFLKNASNKVS